MVQWLRLHTSAARAWVQSLVKEIGSCKLFYVAKERKQNFDEMNIS